MKNINKFDALLSLIIIVCSIVAFIVSANTFKYDTFYSEIDYHPATVVTIESSEDTGAQYADNPENAVIQVHFIAEITDGDLKGEKVGATQYYDQFVKSTLRTVQVGDKVILNQAGEADVLAGQWMMANFDRTNLLIIVGLLFFLIVILIGRKKGVLAIITLGFTVAAVFVTYIPAILSGMNVYAVTIGVTVYIIVMSLLLLNGANNKTYCAIAGNVAGIAVSGLLAFVANKFFLITGIVDQESLYLTYAADGQAYDLQAIVWSGIVIGALGAIMDVSMSLSSSMSELSDNMSEKTRFKLIKSGLNIGHDIIGTMINTLVLAYIGSSLIAVMLIMIYNNNPLVIFNSELVLVEILQAIVGSTGILLTVPLTVLISATVYTVTNNKLPPEVQKAISQAQKEEFSDEKYDL